ncbi:helix-turn-helix domain-containing protein [Pseudomonas sp. NFACC13-1]|uniref:helix-turn-helix domain-containing protein n=1 Tax=Pseudomonas sp. NFACC13-1 TaxID=1566245 RepID=UPI000888D0DB|nr:helix-turn-helix domain-containing protein [Pseudomonas sp. NFACC13-1]SDB54263.1 Helix-turn-helix domain-containing protein [Pseudomonas sp. NFACC13-1]
MSWALSLPVQTLKDSSARHVLLCLANYAGSNGAGAFPSASTLAQDTGLSERTVRYKLDALEESGLIKKGNQAIAAVHIDRHDRRPVVYDLQLIRGANPAPRNERGADDATGCNSQQNGVQPETERGAESAPNTSINHQVTEQQLQREFSDHLAEQDRQTLDALDQPTDSRQRFSMFAKWTYDPDQLESQLHLMGLKFDTVTDEIVGSFKGFFIAKSETRDSAGGWCYRLAKWIKRDRAVKSGEVVDDMDGSGDWTAKGVRL